MCRNGEKRLELVSDVTVEMLKHVLSLSAVHPTSVGKSGSLGLEV